MPASLEGKTVVVTGATSGIGAAVAAQLTERGATVIGIGRREGATITADLADPDARARAIEAIEARAPHVDALVNNAGEAVYADPLELGARGWRALFEINCLAAVELALALAPRLRAGGHLINVSSITARFAPNARFAAYAATKGALDHATEALRLELDPRGVHVTTIAPGLVDTPLYDKVAGFAATRERIARQVPRWLDAADVADAVVWVLTRPAHVVISELVLLPSGQGR